MGEEPALSGSGDDGGHAFGPVPHVAEYRDRWNITTDTPLGGQPLNADQRAHYDVIESDHVVGPSPPALHLE